MRHLCAEMHKRQFGNEDGFQVTEGLTANTTYDGGLSAKQERLGDGIIEKRKGLGIAR